jgi:hydrogenase expression/formation protein HypC
MCLAIPGEILSIADDELLSGRVDFGGLVKEVCLYYVPEARVGDFVVVHAGFAISRVDVAAAERALRDLRAAGALRDDGGDDGGDDGEARSGGGR